MSVRANYCLHIDDKALAQNVVGNEGNEEALVHGSFISGDVVGLG